MAAVNPPSYLQNASHSAKSDRLTIGSLLTPGATPLSVRGGIRGSADGLGMAGRPSVTPDNKVTVRAGTAFVPESSGSGVYVCHNDADTILQVASASPTQSRRDLVVAQVFDGELGGIANRWDLTVVAGTPSSGSPTAPPVPQNSLVLFEVSVPAGGTTAIRAQDITDRRQTTATLGGLIPCTSSTLPTNPQNPMMVWVADQQQLRVWNGTAWRSIQAEDLPNPVRDSTGAVNSTVATTFARLTVRTVVSYTVPKPVWAFVTLAAWMLGGTSTSSRASIALTGATVGPGPSSTVLTAGATSWGEVLFSGEGQYQQGFMSVPVILNQGTTTVEAMGYRYSGSGTAQINYPVLGIVPFRWA